MAREESGARRLHAAAWPDLFSSLQEAYAELTDTRFKLERRATEVAEAREQFEQVIKSMSEALWLVNGAGVVIVANAAAASLIGRPLDAVTGSAFRSLWPDAQIPATPWELLERAPGGALTDMDVPPPGRDGTPGALSVSCSLMRDRAGKASGLVVIARDISARVRAEEAVAMLAEASRVLAESLEADAALERLANVAAPGFADCCVIHIRHDRTLRQLALASGSGPGEELGQALAHAYDPDPAAATGPGQALRSAAAVLDPVVPAGRLASETRTTDLRVLSALAVGSRICVPIVIRGEAVGTISLFTRAGGRRYDADDVGVAEELGRRAATAVDNARLYGAARSVAETLQRSLLPTQLPRLPDVGLAARYVPAEPEPIGGDWYDVFTAPDGRLVLVMGDVAGHGVPAAGAMGRLRHSVRAYALDGQSPAAIMNRLNVLTEPGEMATAVVAFLDPAATTLTWSNAGHLPPLSVSADRRCEDLSGGGPPLGATLQFAYDERTMELGPGSTLLLYTDGLVERRGVPLGRSLAGLMSAATVICAGNLDDALQRLVDDLLAVGGARDDVAVLAARLHSLRGVELELDLQAEPSALARIRRALRRWFEANDLVDPDVSPMMIAAGEACSNVVEHAYGPAGGPLELRARLDDHDVVITVRDRGSWRPRRVEGRGRGIEIARAVTDSVEIEHNSGTLVTLRKRKHNE